MLNITRRDAITGHVLEHKIRERIAARDISWLRGAWQVESRKGTSLGEALARSIEELKRAP